MTTNELNKVYEIRANHVVEFRALQLARRRAEMHKCRIVGYPIDDILDTIASDTDLILDPRQGYKQVSLDVLIDSHNRGLTSDISNSIVRRTDELNAGTDAIIAYNLERVRLENERNKKNKKPDQESVKPNQKPKTGFFAFLMSPFR